MSYNKGVANILPSPTHPPLEKTILCKICLHPISFHPIRRSLRVDGQVGLLMRSLHDGRRRESVGHSTSYKPSPSLAYSLHIKEEADLESSPESPLGQNHGSRPTKLFKNGSDFWNSKTHLGALLKLKANSEASERLKDIPKLLEAAGFLEKSLAFEKSNAPEACGDDSLSLSHSPSFDLKIPQVRVFKTGTETSWDSLPNGNSALLSENDFGKTLHSILPQQIKKKRGVSFITAGAEKDGWPYDNDSQAFGGTYSLDSVSDLNNKQPRKKRGRYRQYNTELLEEAIVVVMDGKMSVSKAQSIYGIPHSTLEYKVKERLGTLKNPPKKKLKLMINQAEEQKMSLSPEGKEIQNSLHIVCGVKESTPEKSENGIDHGSLSENM